MKLYDRYLLNIKQICKKTYQTKIFVQKVSRRNCCNKLHKYISKNNIVTLK